MAHHIEENDRAAYSINPAWHGLGQTFDKLMTTEEMIQAALNHVDVEQGRGLVLYDKATGKVLRWNGTFDGSMALREMPVKFNFNSNLRVDDSTALLSPQGVSDGYEVLQYEELADIGDQILDETGARWESAGTLFNGRTCWALARMPGDYSVEGDAIHRYILLTSSHDGSTPITVQATSTRVVCWNTLSAALNNQSENHVSLRHTVAVRDRIAEAVTAVQKTREAFDAHHKAMETLARRGLTDRFVDAFLKSVFPVADEKDKNTRRNNRINRIMDLWQGAQIGADGPGMRVNGKRTAYGLFNAVAQYDQYENAGRKTEGKNADDQRMWANVFDEGSQAKRRSTVLNGLLDADELESAGTLAVAAGVSSN